MENTKTEIAYFEGVVRDLDDASLTRIDFDELRSRMSDLCTQVAAMAAHADDHALLRADYEQRIAGMVKAIAAVDRKRDRWDEALALAEELPAMPAARLIETYRRVAGRFRDCFPGSFGTQNWCGRRHQGAAR
ncbi:MAG: hypothetical protein AB1772_05445 [Candidatus Zixiibacteriota bacterium]